MENRIATNRKSPPNEKDYIRAYLEANPSAARKGDGLDIAAVKTKDGTTGYGLLAEKFNRSRDNEFHRVKDFISTAELKKIKKA